MAERATSRGRREPRPTVARPRRFGAPRTAASAQNEPGGGPCGGAAPPLGGVRRCGCRHPFGGGAFLALAILIYLRLRSVLGQQTHQRRRIPETGILLTLTAAALVAVSLDVGSAKRFPLRTIAASTTAAPTISGPARVIDGDTVVVAGTTVRLKGVDAAELGTARGESARRAMAGSSPPS